MSRASFLLSDDLSHIELADLILRNESGDLFSDLVKPVGSVAFINLNEIFDLLICDRVMDGVPVGPLLSKQPIDLLAEPSQIWIDGHVVSCSIRRNRSRSNSESASRTSLRLGSLAR